MWTPGILLAVLAVASAQFAWKQDNEYQYAYTSKTATSLRDLSDETDIDVVKAKMVIQSLNENHLIAVLKEPRHASIQARVNNGEIPEEAEEKLQWNRLPLEDPFEIKLKNGVIDQFIVSKDSPVWAVNVYRSILSQFQVDTQGEKLMKSKMNSHPLTDGNDAVFKTMEDTVDGECETLYNISPLPLYVAQHESELVPQSQLVVDGEIMEIVKTRNFSNCERRPVYNFGLPSGSEWEPADNKMQSWFSRSNNQRIVVSGNLKSYTIQSSVTTSRINLSPRIVNTEKAEVFSQSNVTLYNVKPIAEKIPTPENPQVIESLVYDYNSPLESDKDIRAKWDQRKQHSSESSASSSSSEEKNLRRGRRSTQENKSEASLDSSSSSSDSRSDSLSSEEWHQDQQKLSDAPNTPLLPYHIGLMGHSIQQQINVNLVTRKIAEQIGNEVQNPSEIPKAGTMSRFSMLVDIIRTMSQKQIEKTASELYQKSEQQSNGAPTQKYAAWMAYRDAVAEAGTGPALLTITNWIRNRQIEGEEAAQIVATLADAAQVPTPAYMKAFFELVKDEKTQQSRRLATAAAFAFTELLRMAQVDREVSHNRYPVHAYGPLSQKNEKDVVEQYIPYFAKELKKAVREQDSPKIQVNVRALGNIGHPAIVPVFEPYLEQGSPMTTFQRTHLVVSMDKLARIEPRLVQSINYKIFNNKHEDYQVRVAAVKNLLTTDLPLSMLQQMAIETNNEPSQQVRSAVLTGIHSQAQAQGEFNAEYRKKAQAVLNLLAQERMGVQYSQQNFSDYINENLDLSYQQEMHTIGSQDSTYPTSAFYKLRRQLNGQAQPGYKAGYMTSSLAVIADMIQEQLLVHVPQHQKPLAEKITREILEQLKVQPASQDKPEGTMRLSFAGSKRFYSYDEQSFRGVFDEVKQLFARLQTGFNFSYQKFFYDYERTLATTTVSGLPFVYTYKTPSMHAINGKLQIVLKDDLITFNVDLLATVTSRHEAHTGFVTPFDHKQHVAAIDENMQVSFPLNLEILLNPKEMSAQIQMKARDNTERRVAHYSSWPYLVNADILDMKPLSEEQHKKYIEEREPKNYEETFGQQTTGIVYRVKAKTQKKNVDFKSLYDQIQNHNLVSALAFPTTFLGLEQTSIDLFSQSFPTVTITAHYQRQQQQQDSPAEKHDSANHALPSDDKPSSQNRRTEFLSEVVKGIKNAEAHVIDLAIQVEAAKPVQMVATVAMAQSPIAEKSRFLAYYKQSHLQQEKYEAAIDAEAYTPFTPIRDVESALNDKQKAEVRLQINYGKDARNGAQINIKGKLQQTPEYQQYAQQQLNKNVQGQELTQAVKYAGIFDQQEYSIKYQNVGKSARNMVYQVYSVLRHLGYPYMSENIVNGVYQDQSNNARVSLRYSPDLQTMNWSINTPAGDAFFTNVRSHQLVTEVLAVNPMFTPAQRVGSALLHRDYDATCYLQKNGINTFSGRSYATDLQGWHVMAVSRPQAQKNQAQQQYRAPVAVLARQNQGQEIQIITADDTVVEVYPGQQSPVVKVNGQEVRDYSQKVWRSEKESPKIVVFGTPNGEVKIIVDDITLIHDNKHVQLRSSHRRMGQLQGLCGNFNGEEYDLFTPQQTYVEDEQEFAASWALKPEGKTAHLQQQALKNGHKWTRVYNNVVSDQDAGRVNALGKPKKVERYDSSGSSSSSSSESHEQAKNQLDKDSQKGCAVQRIHVLEKDGKHCFSILPQSSCKAHCKVEATKERTTKFYCVEKNSTSEHWANMVFRGANPDFSGKGNSVEMKYDAPIKCSH